MGCGASNNSAANTPQVVAPVNPPASVVRENQHPEKNERSLSTPKMSTASKTSDMNVLVSCHSHQQNISEQLLKSLREKNAPCYIINENTPQSLSARANLIRWCDVFIVIISRSYQRTFYCLETISYAKDVRKPVISLLAESDFQPYGALGALSASSIRSMVLGNDGISHNLLAELSNTISAQTNKKTAGNNVVDPSKFDSVDTKVKLIPGQKSPKILICAMDDGLPIGQLVYEDLVKNDVNVALENLSKLDATCSIERCSVFVPILSPQIERSPVCRAAFEEVRRVLKPIVPVISIKKWKPEDWLGLTIAGATFFRIFDEVSAYKPLYDSNRMQDLRIETEIASRPFPSQAEREQAEIKDLKAKIEECKSQLSSWPPPRKQRTTDPTADRKAVRVPLDEPNAKLVFTHIHHSITRLDRKAPTTLVDEYGLPKRRVIDCMISYQWDNQSLVRQVYEDMSMREIPTWFDIWGSMQGNTNEAMATGVECAKVLLVFLSNAYVKSANCLLEFRYAVKRGKAFVVLRTEAGIPMERWMLEALEGFPRYDVFSYSSLEQLINGVPTIDVIMQAVRKLAVAQPPDIINDGSEELFELRSLLDDARDALSSQAGKSRYKTCTRCNQQFDEYTKGGCKKHRAYYMGGTILEGRWVCCRQQAQDSPGCDPTDHIDSPRAFTQDPSYGTWTWQPS